MAQRTVDYEHQGVVLEGLLAADSGEEKRPGVLIAHAWAGRSDFECDRARALAALGYVGFAADLYGKGVQGSGPEENAALMQPFLDDRALLQARLTAALDVLREQPEVDASRLAAIGYCFGGLCVLDLARIGTELRGVASFHGLFTPPGNTAGTAIKARVLALHGYADPMVPPEAVTALGQELTEAGADWQIVMYGNTYHGFSNPEADLPAMGVIFNQAAERRSWIALQNFLTEIFA